MMTSWGCSDSRETLSFDVPMFKGKGTLILKQYYVT